MQDTAVETSKPIIFFDGVCGLCNRFITFILKVDSKHKFMVSPLQGETAKKVLSPQTIEGLRTIVVWDGEKERTQSNAILYVFKKLGGVWSLFGLLVVIPRFIRDFIYSVVAKYRYGLFGQSKSCRMPTSDEQSRFLM